MKTIGLTMGKIALGALIMGVTLGGCATETGYRYRYYDRYEQPHRCHDGKPDNNRGCYRYWDDRR